MAMAELVMMGVAVGETPLKSPKKVDNVVKL
jgi:hypothetical protein